MALIKTIDEIRKYVPVDANLNFETIKPGLEDAEEWFIKELLGAFYPVLLASYTNGTDADGVNNSSGGMSADDYALLPVVQRCLVYYAMYLSIDSLGVNIGDAGIQQSNSANAQPVQRWKIQALKNEYITKADRFADKLLEYMEGKASNSIFAAWFTDASANPALNGTIVYSTDIASKYIDINQSRRVFLRLKKRIKDIEASSIKNLICGVQYTELIEEIKNDDVSDVNVLLIDLLEPYIAKKALYDTLPALRITITAEGIHLLSVTDSAIIQQPAGDKEIDRLMCSLRDGDFGFLANEDAIKTFISNNIANYPLIAESPCYSATPTPRVIVADNDPCKKHFSV
jgi:hypothetical protein